LIKYITTKIDFFASEIAFRAAGKYSRLLRTVTFAGKQKALVVKRAKKRQIRALGSFRYRLLRAQRGFAMTLKITPFRLSLFLQ